MNQNRLTYKNSVSANILLSSGYDEEKKNINCLLSDVTVNSEMKADFVLGLFINFYEDNPKSTIFVVLRECPNDAAITQANIIPVFSGEVPADKNFGTKKFQHMLNFKDFPFPKDGKYIFELYCIDTDNSPNYLKMPFVQAYENFSNKNNLIDTFEVNIKKAN